MTSIIWKRSARCAGNGACVEAASAAFAKSSASQANGNCAETGYEDGVVFLRDSKDAAGDFAHLHYPAGEWDGGRAVRFTPVSSRLVPDRIRAVALERGHEPGESWFAVRRPGETVTLWFDQHERDAWKAGAEAGEFALAVTAA